MTKETKIGMTALLLFLAIGIAALLLHPMERLFPTTFPVYAVFDDAQGITPGASVLHAGVKGRAAESHHHRRRQGRPSP